MPVKRAMFLSAFAALRDPASRAYFDRRRAEKKKHNAALICLAGRRSDVIYAKLKNRHTYQPSLPATVFDGPRIRAPSCRLEDEHARSATATVEGRPSPGTARPTDSREA